MSAPGRGESLEDGRTDTRLRELIDSDDLDDLIREVDRRADERRWADLARLVSRTRRADETGRQLWPAATFGTHRLVLEAPAEWACMALVDGTSTFGLGPLTEVIAVRHSWEELARWLGPTPDAAIVAHERALRGEESPAFDHPMPNDPFDMAARLAAFEPTYPVATYTPTELSAARPPLDGPWTSISAEASEPSNDVAPDDAVTDAVRHLFGPWVSDGRSLLAITVDGPLDVAVSGIALASGRELETMRISAEQALVQLAWAAADGGPHGRRRGMATGRFDALWLAACVVGLEDSWPIPDAEFGAALADIEWSYLRPAKAADDFQIGFVAHDPADGLSWAAMVS